MYLTAKYIFYFQSTDKIIGQLGDPAGDGSEQLPRDRGPDAVVRAAVDGARVAARRIAAQTAAAPAEPPHLNSPARRCPARVHTTGTEMRDPDKLVRKTGET